MAIVRFRKDGVVLELYGFLLRREYYPGSCGVNGEPTKARLKDAKILYKKVVGRVREYVEGIIKYLDTEQVQLGNN